MPTNSSRTTLVTTDQQCSVLCVLGTSQLLPFAFTPYGHRSLGNDLVSRLGFNGELPDSCTGHYHLGKGYRQFNPVLMRFNSPDMKSPFEEGGLNTYAYCAGDPRNRIDPTGHAWLSSLFRPISKLFRSSKSAKIYKNDAVLSKKISAQKGLKLEKLQKELTATKSNFEQTVRTQKITNLRYEGEISVRDDEITKLKAINAELMKRANPSRPPRPRMPPAIPARPESTLASRAHGKGLGVEKLDYLDLAILNKQTRRQ